MVSNAYKKLKGAMYLSFTKEKMLKYFLLVLLFSTLFLTAGNPPVVHAQDQNQDNYSLQIQGVAWHQTTIDLLLVTPNNQSWWNPIYVNSTLRAIGQWNDAISYFASKYSNYSYLSSLKLEATVTNETKSGFAIYVNWTQSTLEDISDILGLTSPTANLDNVIVNCTISLSTHDSHGVAVNDGDMQNIALHELGHSLGLGHSNYTGDVMYPAYSLLGPARLISTLDVYGVATVFAWIQNPSKFYPVTDWLQSNAVTLSSNIKYSYLPVSAQNARPQTLADNPVVETLVLAAGILIHPEVLVIVILYFVAMIVIARYPRKIKRTQAPKAPS